ncbi:hypothetical protein BASA62_005731 [Batrachochytrium salamandrivorans]|nr:hypothetical protein BASA62_005731 [Batrachochytrium salamandrivorans]
MQQQTAALESHQVLTSDSAQNASTLQNSNLTHSGGTTNITQKQFQQQQLQLQTPASTSTTAATSCTSIGSTATCSTKPCVVFPLSQYTPSLITPQAMQQAMTSHIQQLRQLEEVLSKPDLDSSNRDKRASGRPGLPNGVAATAMSSAPVSRTQLAMAPSTTATNGGQSFRPVNGEQSAHAVNGSHQTSNSSGITNSNSNSVGVTVLGTPNGPPKGSPIFPIAPQQSTRIFSSQALHGLIDTSTIPTTTTMTTTATGTITAPISDTTSMLTHHHATLSSLHTTQQPQHGITVPVMSIPALFRSGGVDDSLASSSTPYGKHRDHFLDTLWKSRPNTNLFLPVSGKQRKRQLPTLVSQIDPDYKFDVEMGAVAYRACKAAKHRVATRMDVQDVQLELERNWNLRIPGYTSESVRVIRRSGSTPSHQARVTQIQRAKRDHQHALIMRIVASNRDADDAALQESAAAEAIALAEVEALAKLAALKASDPPCDSQPLTHVQNDTSNAISSISEVDICAGASAPTIMPDTVHVPIICSSLLGSRDAIRGADLPPTSISSSSTTPALITGPSPAVSGSAPDALASFSGGGGITPGMLVDTIQTTSASSDALNATVEPAISTATVAIENEASAIGVADGADTVLSNTVHVVCDVDEGGDTIMANTDGDCYDLPLAEKAHHGMDLMTMSGKFSDAFPSLDSSVVCGVADTGGVLCSIDKGGSGGGSSIDAKRPVFSEGLVDDSASVGSDVADVDVNVDADIDADVNAGDNEEDDHEDEDDHEEDGNTMEENDEDENENEDAYGDEDIGQDNF